MKRCFLLFIVVLFSSFVSYKDEAVSLYRKEYRTANKDSSSCAALYNKVVKNTSKDNLIAGYKGAVTMMYAGFVKDRAEKLRLFKSGRNILEKAIEGDKENPELILLRFTIQTNAPKILGYNKEMERDKKMLLAKFNTIDDKEVKKSIRTFLLESKQLSNEEKAGLK
ncbi:MAG: hypothetical protein M3R27_09960 [Bacteroidota bacterium]|nr:hypothetical protein [Bacteroidota bacterium]